MHPITITAIIPPMAHSFMRIPKRPGAGPGFGMVLLIAVVTSTLVPLLSALQAAESARLRYPVAIEPGYTADLIFVANERSGSISRISLGASHGDETVTGETQIAQRLADLQQIPSTPFYLACDPIQNELILVHGNRKTVSVLDRAPLPANPQRIAIHPRGTYALISSRWARRLTVFTLDLSNPQQPRMRRDLALDLDYAPHAICYSGKDDLWFVADAFGGSLGLVDIQSRHCVATYDLPANNIDGLTRQINDTTQRLWVAHQSLNSSASTLQPEVQWGVLMDNHLRHLDLAQLLTGNNKDPLSSQVVGMGDETGPGGDPSTVLTAADGLIAVALSGVNRVALSRDGRSGTFVRIPVGKRPRDLLYDASRQRLYVANQFSDTLSVIDTEFFESLGTISLGPQPALTAAQRGEHLFYDASLSLRSWFSCHSCHTDGHANGLLNDNLGDDVFGTPKRILTLLGVSGTEPLSWRGGVPDLEAQILKSLAKTMHNRSPRERDAQDIAAFLRTLTPPPGLLPCREPIDELRLQRGADIFRQERCEKCHSGETYTSGDTYDVGLVDEVGQTEFNPPSLRGVSQRTHFFHDNRANDLSAVFLEHHHPNGKELSSEAIADLTYFLNTL